NGLRGAVASDGTITVAGVRNSETNEGNLVADALRDAAVRRADLYGLPDADVALQNGGGIRNNSVIPAGPITALDTFAIAPFANFVSVIPEVSRERMKAVLEHSVADIGGGQFGQWSGISFTYDHTQPAGSRVVDAALDGGEPIIAGGSVVPGGPLTLATNDFTALGGDAYPLADLPYTRVGVTYQQALETYLAETLGGQVTAAQYPVGGSGRIVRL
ncbi:MAG: bifunctional metallophosphatase/5'-nucleotidase, partial [Nitriliruptorales bacterium]|nr:bifunctional metallophosphatase/5'-nucleotidase [Nitriliruptorales bacterium]